MATVEERAEVKKHCRQGRKLLTDMGNVIGAVAEFLQAVRLDPDEVDAHLGLCWALQKAARFDEALREGREAVRLAPTSTSTHCALGWAFFWKGEYAGAFEELKQSLRFDENNPGAYALRDSLRDAMKTDRAREELREAIMQRDAFDEAIWRLMTRP